MDHLRLLAPPFPSPPTARPPAAAAGTDIGFGFLRFAALLREAEAAFKAEGAAFARSDRLGYLTLDPSHIGTGMTASAVLKLPLTGGSRADTLASALAPLACDGAADATRLCVGTNPHRLADCHPLGTPLPYHSCLLRMTSPVRFFRQG